MNNKTLLIIGGLLLAIGLVKPEFNFKNSNPANISTVTAPTDQDLKKNCLPIIEIIKNGPSSKYYDGKRLSDLFNDLSTLISLDGEDEVIKTTEDIRQANSLAGAMLKLNLKGDYPGLADAAKTLIVSHIGDDSVLLDDNLRSKASDAFKALSWACFEGSK